MNFEKVILAWKQAADDLQIKIQTPFLLTTSDNRNIWYYLLIKNFGSKLGTIILPIEDISEFSTAKEYGYYCSALSSEGYSEYDRNYFIDTLNDWGYFGDKQGKPKWYKGQPWT